jgi:hypothetical protein
MSQGNSVGFVHFLSQYLTGIYSSFHTGMRAISSFTILCSFLLKAAEASLMRSWTSTDCIVPATPPGYNFNDANSQMVDQNFHQGVLNACQRNGAGNFLNRQGCLNSLTSAENTMVYLYQASDADLRQIYRIMFGCPAYNGVPLATAISNSYNTLMSLNSTVFGSKTSPGLVNDLYTIMDGVDQVKAVSDGQLRSIKLATSSQVVAAQNLQGQVWATADAILNQIQSLMQQLVANRTNAQQRSFDNIALAVGQATNNIQTQADGITGTMTNQFASLQGRYGTWTSTTDAAIAKVSGKSSDQRAAVSQVGQAANQVVQGLRSTEFANIVSQVAMGKNQFAIDLSNAQTSIANDITGVGNDLASAVDGNRAQFVNQVSSFAQSLNDRRNLLRSKIASATSVSASNANDAQARADAAVGKLRTMLSTSIQPLLNDVQSAMSKIVSLGAAIDAIRSQTNNDIANIKAPAIAAAQELGSKIANTFSGKRTDFTTKFAAIQSNTKQQISTKVSTGRAQLASIMSGVSSSQGSAASQQMLQSQTAQDQAAASMTAAQLVAAKQQTAADATKAGLSTMVGVVQSAVKDAQSTISAVSQANANNIQALNGAVSSAQQESIQAAYANVQASNQASAARNGAVQSSSFGAQIAGQDLQQTIAQSGTALDASVAYQNRQAQGLLADINDILNVAKQNGGTLNDQMNAFQQQAPALYAVLQQKIAAYKALLVSQGQQAQVSAANNAAGSAQGALTQLASNLQTFASSAMGVTPAMVASQAKVSSDSSALVQNIQSMSTQLSQQANSGAAAISSASQAAMTKAVSQIKSVSSDSAAALAALVNYNSDLIKQKQNDVLVSGTVAIQAALNASQYLTTNAQKFVSLSSQFVTDATTLGGQASQNLSSLVSTINQTLSDVTSSSNTYLQKLSDAAGYISSWPSLIVTQASKINAQVQEKAANVTAAIMSIAATSSSSASDLQQNIRDLQSFVDSLIATFNTQRTSFNDLARQYSMRRMQLLSALDQTIASQKSSFLSGLSQADLTEAQRTGSTTDTLQGLLTQLQTAKAQGSTNSAQVSALMGNIQGGLTGLTNSFASQMGVNLDALKQKATKDAILSQQGLSGTVGGAGSSAQLLAGKLADAVSSIGDSGLAAQIATGGAGKDVYAIAGLLQNTGKETQGKVAALLRSLQTGNMTFSDAMTAAKAMTKRDVSTVMDMLTIFNQYVVNHLGQVYGFNSSVLTSVNALNSTANKAIADHVQVNAASLGSMAVSQYKLGNLSANLLPNTTNPKGGLLNQIQNQRNSTIVALENYMNVVLHGGSPAAALMEMKARHVPISLIEAVSLNSSIPDAFGTVNSDVAKASGQVTTAKTNLDNLVTLSITNANAAVADILRIAGTALSR